MKKLNELLKDPRKAIVLGGLLLAMLLLKVVFNLDSIDITAEELEISDGGAWWVNMLINLALFMTYFLVGVCLAGSFGIFVYRLIQNTKSAVKFGILFGSAMTLFLICWIASTSDVNTMDPGLEFTPGSLKFLGGMVSYTMTLIVLGLVGAAGSSIIKVVK